MSPNRLLRVIFISSFLSFLWFAINFPSKKPASAGEGVWTSTWPEGGIINTVAVDPLTPTTLYAGSNSAGIFKSVDGGELWIPSSTGLTEIIVYEIAINPKYPSIIYAGAGYSIWKSVDSGQSWFKCFDPNAVIRVLIVDPKNPAIIYAGGEDGILKSTNGGTDWHAINNGLPGNRVYSMAIDPINTTTLYAGSILDNEYKGIAKSIDGGAHWFAVNNGLTNLRVRDIAIDPINTQIVFVGTEFGGIFKSTDGGANWNAAYYDGTIYFTVVINPFNPLVIYAAGTSNIKSTDGGTTWDIYVGTGIMHLAINHANPSTLYAATWTGVDRSVDGGLSWFPINKGLTGEMVLSLAIDPLTPTSIYAGGYTSGLWKSTDDGQSWYKLSMDLISKTSIVINPLDTNIIYAGGYGLHKSIDGGENWSEISHYSFGSSSLAIDPYNPEIVYSGGYQAVYKTIDGGLNWESSNTGLPPATILTLSIDPFSTNIVYAGTRGEEIWTSNNSGASWTSLSTDISWIDTDVSAIVIDPQNSSIIYAATTGHVTLLPGTGIFKSYDRGIHWIPINNGLANLNILTLVIDPNNSNTLYAGTYGDGIFKSIDGGNYWFSYSSGLYDSSNYSYSEQLDVSLGFEEDTFIGNSIIRGLKVNPIESSILFAGTDGGLMEIRQNPLNAPQALIDHTIGDVGSYFKISGAGFPLFCTYRILINGHDLGSVTIDINGTFAFLINTESADPGYYVVVLSGKTQTSSSFRLVEGELVYPKEEEVIVINVPAGIAFTYSIFLPIAQNY